MANITTGILDRSSEKAGMTAGAKQCGQYLIRSTPKCHRAAGKPLLRPVKSRWVTGSVQPLKSTTVAPQTEKMICWLVRTIPVTDKTHAVCCNKDAQSLLEFSKRLRDRLFERLVIAIIAGI